MEVDQPCANKVKEPAKARVLRKRKSEGRPTNTPKKRKVTTTETDDSKHIKDIYLNANARKNIKPSTHTLETIYEEPRQNSTGLVTYIAGRKMKRLINLEVPENGYPHQKISKRRRKIKKFFKNKENRKRMPISMAFFNKFMESLNLDEGLQSKITNIYNTIRA